MRYIRLHCVVITSFGCAFQRLLYVIVGIYQGDVDWRKGAKWNWLTAFFHQIINNTKAKWNLFAIFFIHCFVDGNVNRNRGSEYASRHTKYDSMKYGCKQCRYKEKKTRTARLLARARALRILWWPIKFFIVIQFIAHLNVVANQLTATQRHLTPTRWFLWWAPILLPDKHEPPKYFDNSVFWMFGNLDSISVLASLVPSAHYDFTAYYLWPKSIEWLSKEQPTAFDPFCLAISKCG